MIFLPLRTKAAKRRCKDPFMRPYWTQEKERFTFTIRGDGFLYRMVRNIVGCLVKVGTGGSGPIADFAAVMAAKDRKKAGVAAPARIVPGSRILPGRDCRDKNFLCSLFAIS